MNKNKDKEQTEDNKNNGVHWLLWWLIDDDELNQQVEQYDKLKITQSARGLSLLFLCFSALLTIIFILFLDLDSGSFVDIVVLLILGFFIYKGHKWAMISAMVVWTIEKAFGIYNSLITNSSEVSFTSVILPLIWWSTYMHFFYLAFKTERLRIKKVKKSKQKEKYIWICDFCGKKFDSEKEVTEHEKICQLKNKEDKIIFCVKCGIKNKITSNFCIKCGNKIIH